MKFNSPRQRKKVALLGGLYTSQSMGLSFLTMALPAILRQYGMGLDKIGWLYALGLIWRISFLWAPIVDRFGSQKYGHYRSWILVMQTLLIIAMIGGAFFTVPGLLSILAVLIALVAIFSSTQDIAADALAVTILEPEERGLGNSIQAAGNMVGSMIGSGVVLITYQWIGWKGSMLALAAGTALPLISILRHKEQLAPADTRKKKVNYKDLIRFFYRPRIWRWIPVLLTFRISNAVTYGLLSPLLVDLGWSLDRIGFTINMVGTLFGIAGAGLVGWIVSRWGRKTAMILTMLLTTLATIGLFVPAQGINNPVIVYVIIGLIMSAYGSSSAVMYTVIMDKSDSTTAGTDFTLQMAISGFPALISVSLAMGFVESIGYFGVLVVCIGIAILSMALIWFYKDFDLTQFSAKSHEDALSPVIEGK